jgi:hypothetical protein
MATGVAFCAQTGGTVALAAAATAKTILNVIAASDKIITLTEFGIAFDGTTASEKPILVELCRSTQAGAGTKTDVTPVQVRGQAITSGATAAKGYTAEPTTLTAVREWLVDPNKGLFVMPFPQGREVETLLGDGLCLRMTIQTGGAAVNARCYMEYEE